MTDHHYPCITLDQKIGKVTEESGEVIKEVGSLLHALGKAQRHGWQPTDARTNVKYNNAEDARLAIVRLRGEIHDLLGAMDELDPELMILAQY